MQATFALQIIAWALGETPEQGKPTKKVVVTPTPRLIRTVHRFKALFRSWITSHVDQFEKERYPELDRLFSELYRVMTQSSIIFSNLKMKADHGSIEVETAQIISILKSTRKAIIAAQNITHMRGLEGWTLPERPPSETSHSDATLLKYERMELQNEKRATIVYRRKRAIQCCMFVALSLFQFLYPGDLHDFVAEYEDEVVRETFDRTVSIDDAKTYESLQMKGHCRARLTAPADRIPKWNVPLNQRSIIPRFVRNPMRCGAPIVSNLYGRTGKCLFLLACYIFVTNGRIL
ncbi:hypothetical protein B0T10DRAFT_65907 [Thelonectria olida]|uniref:Uncharacterized protein n=1 Tax=Thelonectria olida TaxID=1576542 RepID=A0A9P8W3B7_9HYPO|nr:hypothetical protein B0T10DRAFT_65907 [Thelonectria olida]